MQFSEKMTRRELRATVALASIYGLRMLGMFLILPIFAIYAETLEGGSNHTLIGLALGAYGLMQVLLQLPFGMASDKFGRKRVIYLGLLLFALGSVVAALSTSIYGVIIGRAIQGAGAISAVVTALVADSTREEHRTKAMAMIGATIGLTFALSLVAGPIFNQWIGVSGIFWMTGILSLLAILVVKYAVPKPLYTGFHSDAQAAPSLMKDVLKDMKQRIAESLETALRLADGKAIALEMDSEKEHLFSAKFSCPVCDYSLAELEPPHQHHALRFWLVAVRHPSHRFCRQCANAQTLGISAHQINLVAHLCD